MKLNFKSIIFACFAMFVFLSCGKDDKDPNEKVNDQITANSWSVKSFTADGVEQMGFGLNSYDMTYSKEDSNAGTTRWTLINTAGQAQKFESKYTIRNQGTELDVEGDIFEISIKDNKLSMNGSVGTVKWIIDARK